MVDDDFVCDLHASNVDVLMLIINLNVPNKKNANKFKKTHANFSIKYTEETEGCECDLGLNRVQNNGCVKK